VEGAARETPACGPGSRQLSSRCRYFAIMLGVTRMVPLGVDHDHPVTPVRGIEIGASNRSINVVILFGNTVVTRTLSFIAARFSELGFAKVTVRSIVRLFEVNVNRLVLSPALFRFRTLIGIETTDLPVAGVSSSSRTVSAFAACEANVRVIIPVNIFVCMNNMKQQRATSMPKT